MRVGQLLFAHTTVVCALVLQLSSSREPRPLSDALEADADSRKSASAAAAADLAAQDAVNVAGNILPGVVAAEEKTKETGRSMGMIAKAMDSFGIQLERAEREAADEVVDDTALAVEKEAISKAQADGKVKAAAWSKTHKEGAQAAGDAALKPYAETMGRVAATASEYAKDADALSSAAAGLQIQASMAFGAAGQWKTVGNTVKAQKSLEQAHNQMNLAKALQAKAASEYATAQRLMGEAPAYMAMGLQAQAHAMTLVDPDVPPPPAPLV